MSHDHAKDTSLELLKEVLFSPHRIALITIWVITTISLVLMLHNGVRNNFQFYSERNILHVGYTLAFFWYLIRTGPSTKQLPDVSPILLPKRKIGKLIPVIIITLLLVSEFYDQGIVLPLLMLATLLILIVWRREIDLSPIIIGLFVTVIAFLGGLPAWQNQFLGSTSFFGLLVFIMPMFVASNLLYKRTGLGGSQLYLRQYGKAIWSFLWGCILFIPFGLINAASGSPGPWITWVTNWWQPFTLPIFSGIAEEVWFRLIMVTLCYFLLRPAFNKAPIIPIVFSMLFSGIIHGLGHGGSLMDNFLITGLLYSFPNAVIFARRDWEHAIGAHYMINFIPWIMVFLEAT
jgi:hypothetical protein